MLPPGIVIRRATLDDLEMLRGVWREFQMPEHELEKRFTEFQIAVDDQGWILGTLAIRFHEHDGQVHGLALRRSDLGPELAAALWERVRAVADQQGAYRLWTRERGEFWGSCGFTQAGGAGAGEAPALFGGGTQWLTLKLRDEPLKLIAAEEQLEAFLEMERLRTESMVKRVQFLKILATAFAGLLFLGALAALFLLVRRNRRPARNRPIDTP